MWPALFGAGWIWGVLVAACLMGFIVGGLGFLYLIVVTPSPPQRDEVAEAWHRYEEGDLIPPEWDRMVRGLAVSRPAPNCRVA